MVPAEAHLDGDGQRDRLDDLSKRLTQAEAERIIRDDPLVQTLLAQYRGARIVPGSVRPA